MSWLPGLVLCALSAAGARAEAGPAPGVERVSDSIVQVGIVHRARRITITPQGSFSLIDQTSGEVQKLVKGRAYAVEADKGRRLLVGPHLLLGQTRLLSASPNGHLLVEGVKYRGNLILKPQEDATVTVVDEMGLEEYLHGVLPIEMNPAWPLEALKAQAVVARTFTLNNLGKFADSGYDLSDDSRSQIYSGLEIESERIRRAVRDTAGEVLTWQGRRLQAFFHSCCGGHTADPGAIWGSPGATPPPLRGVRDRFCRDCPSYRWEVYLPEDRLLATLQSRGFVSLRLASIRPGEREGSGHLRTLRLTLDGREAALRANDFRNWVGSELIKSTRIESISAKRSGYLFTGRGYGHGAGLCQWGARAMALRGKEYRAILRHYFPGSRLARHGD